MYINILCIPCSVYKLIATAKWNNMLEISLKINSNLKTPHSTVFQTVDPILNYRYH